MVWANFFLFVFNSDKWNCTTLKSCHVVKETVWKTMYATEERLWNAPPPHSLKYLNTWSPMDGTVCEDYGIFGTWGLSGTGGSLGVKICHASASSLSFLLPDGSQCEKPQSAIVYRLSVSCCPALCIMMERDSLKLWAQIDLLPLSCFCYVVWSQDWDK